MVNKVTETLFKKYKTAKDYAQADLDTFQDEIKAVTFFRNKAKNIINLGQALLRDHGGEIPKTMEELVALPGVGRKTANLVLTICFNVPGIVVDTHVIRVSGRLGLTKNKDPEKIERDLYALLPEKDWIAFSNRLIILGRYTCTAQKSQPRRVRPEGHLPVRVRDIVTGGGYGRRIFLVIPAIILSLGTSSLYAL